MTEIIVQTNEEELGADAWMYRDRDPKDYRYDPDKIPVITAEQVSEIDKIISDCIAKGDDPGKIQAIVDAMLVELCVDPDLVADDGAVVRYVDTKNKAEVVRPMLVNYRDFGTHIRNANMVPISRTAEPSEQPLIPDLASQSYAQHGTAAHRAEQIRVLSSDGFTAKQPPQADVRRPDLSVSPVYATEEQLSSTAEEVQEPADADKDKIKAEIKSLVNDLWLGLGEDARKYIELYNQVEDVISQANLALRSIPNTDTQRLFGEIKKTFNLFEYQINSQRTQQRKSDVGKLKGLTINGQQGEVVSGIKDLDYQLTAYLESGQRDTSQICSALEMMIRNINNFGLDEEKIMAIRNQLSLFMDLIASRRQQIFTLQDRLGSVLSSLQPQRQ